MVAGKAEVLSLEFFVSGGASAGSFGSLDKVSSVILFFPCSAGFELSVFLGRPRPRLATLTSVPGLQLTAVELPG